MCFGREMSACKTGSRLDRTTAIGQRLCDFGLRSPIYIVLQIEDYIVYFILTKKKILNFKNFQWKFVEFGAKITLFCIEPRYEIKI